MKILYIAAGALQRADGAFLVAKRPAGKPHAGLWEFPGGKIEADETPAQALVREFKEELDVTIDPHTAVPLTFVSEPVEDVFINMFFYLMPQWQGQPKALEGQELAWITPDDFADFRPHSLDGCNHIYDCLAAVQRAGDAAVVRAAVATAAYAPRYQTEGRK